MSRLHMRNHAGQPQRVTAEQKEQLEAILDGATLSQFLFTISEILGEKAEHLTTNWNAFHSASVWSSLGAGVEKIAQIAQKEGL
jgi:hypothetical protein